ncbi:hypothetical protein HUU53_03495 [Candidatus Micrarchaeota archaeon]|nr:hypothetical protein [Candidatus Micrarchaeota archaeon]
MVQEIIGFILTFLLFAIPGLLLSRAWFKGTSLNKLEKAILGLFLGLSLNPLLSALENAFFGVKFTFSLVLVNALIISVIGLIALWKQKQLTIPKLSFGKPIDFLKKNYAPIILLLLMVLSFYPRVATSWKTDFFEFDPYFYAKLSEKIVTQGEIPFYSDEVYFVAGDPASGVYYRAIRPLVSYLTSSIYSSFAFFSQQSYDQSLLILSNGIYPPLAGALMAFFVFLFFKYEYNEKIGLIAAAFVAFTPQLIKKFAAGVFELSPWGILVAIALFAIAAIAFKQKSYRLGILAGLLIAFNVLSSSNYIWALMVLATFMVFKAFIDYYTTGIEKKDVHISLIIAGSALLSDVAYIIYQKLDASVFVSSISLGVLLVTLSVVPFVLFYFLKKMDKKIVTAGLVVAGLVFLLFTPVGNLLLNYPSALTGFATTGSPLSKTIQEEGASSQELFDSSYGVLNPPFLMFLTTLAISLNAFFALWNKNKLNYGLVFLAIVALFTFFNSAIDSILKAVFPSVDLITFIVSNDVFIYLGISLLAALIILYYSEEKRYALLWGVLIVFPVAFIGLSKLKFIVHLAAALTIAVGFLIGELMALFTEANNKLKVLGEKALTTYLFGLILLIGAFGALAQGGTVERSMTELSYSQIPPDWIAAMNWIETSAPKDARFISWWDYGHWITFLGQRKSVLDPGNLYPGFNQGVAQAFVEGPRDELVSVMTKHDAQYILLDADLISKWGALVFLSGSCDSQIAENCPAEKQIPNWEGGPGQSLYEAQHYFELFSPAGSCPSQLVPVQLPMYQSTFGASYCVTQNSLLLLTSNGIGKEIPLKQIAFGDNPTKDSAYVIGYGQGSFLNVNPYLGGTESKVLDAPFVRLFFFENLPGFSLEYSSPNGQVKIFKLNN